ncbi:hypothetical protein HELRODRAFT_162863 [Helobdella robusta]|uniref:Uncharacterized protein n=1 Tax=Helobdella robusta TaxID=6412 RepID=T1ETA5_HELRO|nr:hypothetical protein HELRODRAFT_162863 [Helobdella robusta]ESN99336.1 hypothetical protein HELRODRAFT_162863 [Helobdella robusta]
MYNLQKSTPGRPKGKLTSANKRVSIDVRIDRIDHFQSQLETQKRCAHCYKITRTQQQILKIRLKLILNIKSLVRSKIENSAMKYSLQDVLTMIEDDDSIIEADIFISPPADGMNSDEDDVLDEIHDQGSFDDLPARQLLSNANATIKHIGGSKKIGIVSIYYV